MPSFKKILHSLSNLKVFFWSVLWLIVLLTVGTIKQKEIGLYQSQLKYFDSWFFKIGPLPLPGGLFTLGLIYLGLCSQLLLKTSFFNFRKCGITIAHLGSLMLLTGGIVTHFTGIEGSMIIPEGKTINFFQDYHQVELAIIPISTPEQEQSLLTIPQNLFSKKNLFRIPTTTISLRLKSFFRNSEIEARASSELKNEIGFLSKFKIKDKNISADENDNHPAFLFEINGSARDGSYAVFRDMPIIQTLTSKEGHQFKIEVRQLRHYLPFTITLNDFEKILYPSSSIPKSFKSDITVHDAQVNQKIVIQMNEPLRYKGYTFYQSSFSENSDGQITDLAVVKNSGKYFPYFSSIIICFGLFIHLMISKSHFFKSEKV